LHCTHCGCNNHKIEDCYHASKPKCTVCKKLGHKEDECSFKKKTQKPCKSKDKKITESSALKKETHIVENGSDDEILAAIGDDHFMITNNPLIDNVFNYNRVIQSSQLLAHYCVTYFSTYLTMRTISRAISGIMTFVDDYS
jgi:hypothetical protein